VIVFWLLVAFTVVVAVALVRELTRHKHDPEIVRIETRRYPFTTSDHLPITHPDEAAMYQGTIDPALVPEVTPVREDTLHLRCKTCGHEWTEPYDHFWDNL